MHSAASPHSNRKTQQLHNTPWHLPPRQHPLEGLIHTSFDSGFTQCVLVVKPHVNDDLDGAGREFEEHREVDN